MGKRELFIVLAFVALGAGAYQLTAPAPRAGERRFSWAAFMANLHSGGRGNQSTATVTTHGEVALTPTATELRLHSISTLVVVGDSPRDIAYDLTVEASGRDDAAARRLAEQSALRHDDLGAVVAVSVATTPDSRRTAALTLHVPARLALRIDGPRQVDISRVAQVRLENITGDVRLDHISGAISGSQRNGRLDITESGSVDLALVSAHATVTNIRGAVSLNARNGDGRLSGVAGPIEVDASGHDTAIIKPLARVRVGGSGGTLTIEQPAAAVTVDVRRMRVTLLLGVSADVAVFTTDEPLTLTLEGEPRVTLDAATTEGGTIQTDDPALAAEEHEGEWRLSKSLGGPTRVALRNQRAPIVIGQRK